MAEIRIPAPDGGDFMAFMTAPGPERAPVVVVIQEIFGVNQVMRGICHALSAQGYIAVCPDLFWRQQPEIQLTDRTQAEWDRAVQLMTGLDIELAIADLNATLAAVRQLPGATGKAGVVGYCLGGKLAFLMAARSDANCVVGYYGVGLDELIGEAPAIRHPLLLHIAEEDRFVSKPAQASIRAALEGHPQVTIHTYPGVDHAFARVGGAHFDPAAAELANQRTARFFAHHLKP